MPADGRNLDEDRQTRSGIACGRDVSFATGAPHMWSRPQKGEIAAPAKPIGISFTTSVCPLQILPPHEPVRPPATQNSEFAVARSITPRALTGPIQVRKANVGFKAKWNPRPTSEKSAKRYSVL